MERTGKDGKGKVDEWKRTGWGRGYWQLIGHDVCMLDGGDLYVDTS